MTQNCSGRNLFAIILHSSASKHRVWALKPPLCCLRGPYPLLCRQEDPLAMCITLPHKLATFCLSLAELYVIRKVKATCQKSFFLFILFLLLLPLLQFLLFSLLLLYTIQETSRKGIKAHVERNNTRYTPLFPIFWLLNTLLPKLELLNNEIAMTACSLIKQLFFLQIKCFHSFPKRGDPSLYWMIFIIPIHWLNFS